MDDDRRSPIFPMKKMTRRFSQGDADSFVDVCLQCPDSSLEQPCEHMGRREFNRPNIDNDEHLSETIVKSARYLSPNVAATMPVRMCKACNSNEASSTRYLSTNVASPVPIRMCRPCKSNGGNSTRRKIALNTSESSEDNQLNLNSDHDRYLTLPRIEIEAVDSTSIRRHQVRRMSAMIKIHGIRDDDGEDSDGYKFDLGRHDDDDGSDSDEDNASGRKSYDNLPSWLNRSDDFGHPDDRRGNKKTEEGERTPFFLHILNFESKSDWGSRGRLHFDLLQ